ncbi:hypothetical protein ABZS66_21240 [Dactylosporangium sp. NPDC005572]|uniref:hypothetical protein n=1 Tax=Dactylosporangium sp. NPDC005572 TaxID=3156889 RepID=UPI0033A1CF08
MLPPAPAPEAVLFRATPRRTAGYIAVCALATWCLLALASALVSLNTGGFWDGVRFAFSPVVILPALAGSGLGLLITGAARVWARLSAAGLELGHPRSILVAWPDVEAAVRRGRWIFTTVEIVLRPDAPVAEHDGKGRLPMHRMRRGRRGYSLWPALYDGGVDAFTDALARHGVEVRRP